MAASIYASYERDRQNAINIAEDMYNRVHETKVIEDVPGTVVEDDSE